MNGKLTICQLLKW